MIANQAASADTAGKLFQALQGEELDRAIDEIFDIVHVPPGVGRERCIVKTGIDDRRRHQRLGWFNPDV